MCNNAQLRDDKIIGHPTEGAMLAISHKVRQVVVSSHRHTVRTAFYGNKFSVYLQLGMYSVRDQFVRTEERAFNSEHKWMGVKVRRRTHEPAEVRLTGLNGPPIY